ncbi:hypothetical protein D3C85_1604000 [compost metagenome]
MRFHNTLAYGESKPCAGDMLCTITSIEFLEYPLHISWNNACPFICNCQTQPIAYLLRMNKDFASFRRILDGIADHIHQHLFNKNLIQWNGWKIRIQSYAHHSMLQRILQLR